MATIDTLSKALADLNDSSSRQAVLTTDRGRQITLTVGDLRAIEAEYRALRLAITLAIEDLTPEKDWTWPALEEARQAALASLRRALEG